MTLPKTKQPKKQRKRLYNAPMHRRIKMMTAPLSHELRNKYGVRRLPVHKGDRVVVFQNKHADDEIKGRVIEVLPKKYAIYIESYSKEKADGTIVSFPVHPSNVVITSLNLRDRRRRELIKRKSTKEITDEDFEESIFEAEEETIEETIEETMDETEEEFEEFEEISDEEEESE
ncbi:MAG: 50S ribosomal protein L24 [Candidatus Heimdallarchaeaceae archaeon]